MIKNLRVKFVAAAMAIVLVVFAVVVITLNAYMRESSIRETDRLLELIAQADGRLPFSESLDGRQVPETPLRGPEPAPDRMRFIRFFYVKADGNGGVLEYMIDMMNDMEESEALSHFGNAQASGRERGDSGNLRFLIQDTSYGSITIFAEISAENILLQRLIDVSLWVAAISCAVLLLVSIVLSGWVVRPVRDAFNKQRRFISDASHELKTPLTIICADADVLENEIGENTWLTHIKTQTARMGFLVHDLLSLAKTDEQGKTLHAEFDISQAVLSTSLEFESRAFEEGKNLLLEVVPNLRFIGDEPRIKQVCAILLDNAVRYSGEGAEIEVSLKAEGGKLLLSVYNTGPGIPQSEFKKVFERFYRSDQSRARTTGGYGLGLSIAQSVVEVHKGKISVVGKQGEWVRFNITLPAKMQAAE